MSGQPKVPQIPMQGVDSSHLAEAGHDEATRTLQIAFRDGQIYQYQGVPASVYNAMLDAKSKGQFFNANIKNSFKSMRLTPPPKPKAKDTSL